MILGMILVLMTIGIAIGFTVYATFLPFIEILGTIKFHNSAYYGALASLERGQLVLSYKQPGFVGSGGWQGANNVGPLSDQRPNDFGLIGRGDSHLWRNINSRTNIIPKPNQTNVPPIFWYDINNSTGYDYKALDYYTTARTYIDIDTTNDAEQYYQPTTSLTRTISSNDTISINLRLNPFIYQQGFNQDNLCQCDQDEDTSNDDALVTWSIGGKKNGKTYRFNPIQNIDRSQKPASILEGDSFIRESHLQGTPPATTLRFGNKRNPLNLSPDIPGIGYYTLISPDATLSGLNYQQIWGNTDTNNTFIQIELINKLLTQNNDIYPFLEYQIDAGDAEIADTHYMLEGVGRVLDYEVRIQYLIPTNKESINADFTVIF